MGPLVVVVDGSHTSAGRLTFTQQEGRQFARQTPAAAAVDDLGRCGCCCGCCVVRVSAPERQRHQRGASLSFEQQQQQRLTCTTYVYELKRGAQTHIVRLGVSWIS